MIYGYARCSTNENKQDINRQVRELKKENTNEIYIEWEHGDCKCKEQLYLLLNKIESGDIIVTTEISRLARSTKQLCEIIDIIKNKKCCLKVINSITVDCTNGNIDPMANAFVQMSGVFAELELKIIRERVKSGVANAKAKGKKIGRPKFTKKDIPDIFYKYYDLYNKDNLNISELARLSNLSRNTVYKYIRMLRDENVITE